MLVVLQSIFDELRVMMLNSPINILAVNETKLDGSFSENEINVLGYHVIHKNRNRHGGGLLLYVRDSIPFTERNDLLADTRNGLY